MGLCKCLVMTAAAIVYMSSAAAAGVPSYDGTEHYFWNEHAVVIAEIAAKKPVGRNDRLTLKVLAVAATDRFVPTTLEMELYNGGAGGIAYSGRFRLGVDETYIVCLRLDQGGKWHIEEGFVTFFDSATGVDQIRDLEDPALRRFLVRLREVRSKASLNAAKRAAELEQDQKQ